MAKASDLIGRSGAGGFLPPVKKSILPLAGATGADESKHQKTALPKDAKPAKAAKAPAGGGGASSVRPKV